MEKSNNKNIIDRIRKLLRMAKDVSSPNEAAIAAARARKLMDQYQIQETDIVNDTEFSINSCSDSYRYTPKWKSVLSVAIANYNDCIANINYKGQISFKGHTIDTILAVNMYDYLTTTVDKLCKSYMKEQGYTRYVASIGNTYKIAASRELVIRLEKLLKQRQQDFVSATGTSIVLCKMNQVNSHFGPANYKLVKKNNNKIWKDEDATNAFLRGRIDGQNINLSQQVENQVFKLV